MFLLLLLLPLSILAKELTLCYKAYYAFFPVAQTCITYKLQGGCQVPIGAYAWIEGDRIKIKGFISDLEGERFLEGNEEGSLQEAEEVGKRLAQRLLREGGEEILKEIYGL